MEKLEKFLNDKTKYCDGYLLIKYQDATEFYALIRGESQQAEYCMEKVLTWDGMGMLSGINPNVMLYKDCIAIEVDELEHENIEEDIFECIERHCLYYM